MLEHSGDTHHWTQHPQHDEAVVVPNVARALLSLVNERGISTAQLCRGLGFGHEELLDLDMRLSYRQTRTLITRARRILADPALGLSTGIRQTPVSWGFAGLAMLTCETLGEAMRYGLEHQGDTGALMEHQASQQKDELVIEVKPKVFDLDIEPFLVEEAFSSVVAVVRRLAGPSFSPLRIELAYSRPAYADSYSRIFRCPIKFKAGRNRLISAAQWLTTRLPDYDDISCAPLRAKLDQLLDRGVSYDALVESLRSHIRAHLDDPLALQTFARQLNMSERTLRRRLTVSGVSYSQLLDQIRHERACDLLNNTAMTLAQIAHTLGYSDARVLRRAFKRWTGTLPSEQRQR
ncbi:AraC-like DNA-binding protein [Pseudomonas sp. URMO17WK12:I1]|uniref:AraC family transcriptional regulator n=1 Tax=unclassified Pseudomonas TaxID=196821 RepID=UPI00047FB4EE|nr:MULTISPECIES: AraC family transcriptional regulator [unclassified Pseudomonas]PZW71489.1 AraC-like DNA-binding protein [Pseudomonas sp. URMO17WK12:I1]